MQYHEVKLNIQLAADVPGIRTPVNAAAGKSPVIDVQCFVDYVYLDTDERRRFAQVSHEYLIQQLQFTGDESLDASTFNNGSGSKSLKLTFNHPTKFLAWVFKGAKHGQYTGKVDGYANVNTYNEAYAPMRTAKLQLNGHDRFSERYGSYFNQVVPWQTLRARVPAGIYMYSFSLKPDEHQPSGSCNFSRIDNAQLQLGIKQAVSGAINPATIDTENKTVEASNQLNSIKVFAENYNVFRFGQEAGKSYTPRHSGSMPWELRLCSQAA